MHETHFIYLIFIPFLLFPFLWFFVIKVLMKKAKMQKILNVEKGEKLSQSQWGSGLINNVNFQNSIRINEYSEGYLIETRKLYGAGQIWFKKSQIKIDSIEAKTYFKPKIVRIKCAEHSAFFSGALCDLLIKNLSKIIEPNS